MFLQLWILQVFSNGFFALVPKKPPNFSNFASESQTIFPESNWQVAAFPIRSCHPSLKNAMM